MRFDVIDAAGAVAAQGLVGGDPIELPEGRYVVRAQTTPPIESPVTVAGGKTHAPTLSGP